jgi:hypothetical protein
MLAQWRAEADWPRYWDGLDCGHGYYGQASASDPVRWYDRWSPNGDWCALLPLPNDRRRITAADVEKIRQSWEPAITDTDIVEWMERQHAACMEKFPKFSRVLAKPQTDASGWAVTSYPTSNLPTTVRAAIAAKIIAERTTERR